MQFLLTALSSKTPYYHIGGLNSVFPLWQPA